MAPKVVSEVTIDLDPETYETQNVHVIYDQIASHFSSTRYKVTKGYHLTLPVPFLNITLSPGRSSSNSCLSCLMAGSDLTLGLEMENIYCWTGRAVSEWLDLTIASIYWRLPNKPGERHERWSSEMSLASAGGNTLLYMNKIQRRSCRSEGIQDYAISIATIHHLATPRRRMLAVQASTKFSMSR